MKEALDIYEITSRAVIRNALHSSEAEVYACAGGGWNVLGFGRFHEITFGLVESMIEDGELVPKWPDCDGVYILPGHTKSQAKNTEG